MAHGYKTTLTSRRSHVTSDATDLHFLYVADFFNASVDVFDANFMPDLNLPPTAFKDPQIPDGFAPFNVQNLDGNIFVTFAKQGPSKMEEDDGPGLGFVDQFDSSGNLLLRLRSGRGMDAPWGIALAPDGLARKVADSWWANSAAVR